MPVYDASSYAGDLFGWKSEFGARIQDALARKSVPVTAKIGTLVRKIESAVSFASLKGALRDLKAYLRHARPARADDEDFEVLFQKILEHRRAESIENYGAYIFTVEIDI